MIDVLLLNTAVTDFRGEEFAFVERLAGPGGLAKCSIDEMPAYTQQQYQEWIQQGRATAGGLGNSAPLMSRAGIRVAVGVNLGKGPFGGLDAQGRFFFDVLAQHGIDTSQILVHEKLPTGTTFIHESARRERAGIAYFPNANDDFAFEKFRDAFKRLHPKIVYYTYSGLSRRGDANEGRDLAEFVKWCRSEGAITIVDSHTLTGRPRELMEGSTVVKGYHLLLPLLGELDIFFTSAVEARLIENALRGPGLWDGATTRENIEQFLAFLTSEFWEHDHRTKLFGVTVKDGAYHVHMTPEGSVSGCCKTTSRFSCGEVVDLTGAGDSFRAGLICYLARHLDSFKRAAIRFDEAAQMGNLFAALYVHAPLQNRYRNIASFEKMLQVVRGSTQYGSIADLLEEVSGV